MNLPDLCNCTVAILGLGYVGLPLCVEIGKRQKCNLTGKKLERRVIGFDVDISKITDLRNSLDITKQISKETLKDLSFIEFEFETKKLSEADVFIVTVPTPIDESYTGFIICKKESNIVGCALKDRSNTFKSSQHTTPVVIYESTVYPGVTEEICVPIVERESNLKINSLSNKSFVCGYSPERINPGDNERTSGNS